MKMTGWKTKTGAGLIAAAGVLTAIIPFFPPAGAAVATIVLWAKFGSALLAAAGAAFMGVGISHKIEKAGQAKES